MKKRFMYLLLFSLILCSISEVAAQTVIKGELVGKIDTTLYITYTDDKGFKNDVLNVKDGVFEWNKQINFPSKVVFSLSKRQSQDSQNAVIWTMPGVMELTLNVYKLSDYKLTGSKLDSDVKSFEKELLVENEMMITFMKKVSENSSSRNSETLRHELNEIYRKLAFKKMKYLEKNPESYYSAYLLDESQLGLNLEQTRHYLGLLKGNALNSPFAKKLVAEIRGATDGSEGSKAVLFTAKNINGGIFDLAELVGKNYIIIDFWASWCVPCRKGNPHLKELFEKYKDKGLSVVCVADNDSSEKEWRKAVETDGIGQFIHVLRGWRGLEYFFDRQDLSTKYGVHTLPTKFLIGKDGIIIKRYGEAGEAHEAIDSKLVEIFGF